MEHLVTLSTKFIFKGDRRIIKKMPKNVKDYLIEEFVDRRSVFCDLVNPMYEEWNKEFDTIYPNTDGYSKEYINFIADKQKEALEIANNKSIGINEIILWQDIKENPGDIYGYVKELDIYIFLRIK